MGALFLLAPQGTSVKSFDSDTALPRTGKFLIKAFVDKKHRLEKDPTLMLGKDDYYGKLEIEFEDWKDGFRFGKLVAGGLFQSDVSK